MKYSRVTFFALMSLMINAAGTETKKIAGGKGDGFAWSVHEVLVAGGDRNLIVMICNTGAKWLDTEGIDANFFKLTSADGKRVKISRVTGFTGIASNGVTIGHVRVDNSVSSLEKYRLELKAKKDSLVPVSFVAPGLEFDRQAQKSVKAVTGVDSVPKGNGEYKPNLEKRSSP